MSVQREQSLSQAFELIEADRLDEARAILKPILDTEKDNPDVWWLYAHAVTDPEAARVALNNVRRLDPNYPNASELLYSLEAQIPGKSAVTLSPDAEPSFLPPAPTTLPGMASSEGDWDIPDNEGMTDGGPIFRRPAFLLALGTIIFVIVAALVVLRPPSDQVSIGSTPTTLPEIVVENPTLELVPTDDATLVTGQQVTEMATLATVADHAALVNALSAFNVLEDDIVVEPTSLGNTLMVRVCTEAGPTLRGALPEVMKIIAGEVDSAVAGVEAVGARMVDCNTDTTLLAIGVSASDAQAYMAGGLADADFQAKWQPII